MPAASQWKCSMVVVSVAIHAAWNARRSGFQSGKPALHAVIEAGGRCVTDFLFPPVFCAEYGLHAYGGIRIGFHAYFRQWLHD